MLEFKGENFLGGKKLKDRLILLVVLNMDELERLNLKIFVVFRMYIVF